MAGRRGDRLSAVRDRSFGKSRGTENTAVEDRPHTADGPTTSQGEQMTHLPLRCALRAALCSTSTLPGRRRLAVDCRLWSAAGKAFLDCGTHLISEAVARGLSRGITLSGSHVARLSELVREPGSLASHVSWPGLSGSAAVRADPDPPGSSKQGGVRRWTRAQRWTACSQKQQPAQCSQQQIDGQARQ